MSLGVGALGQGDLPEPQVSIKFAEDPCTCQLG